MRRLLKKGRHWMGSRSASVALRTLLGPFRLLVLTPLVLLKLTQAEQDAYFFLFASWSVGSVFAGSIDSLFTRRLARAVDGGNEAGDGHGVIRTMPAEAARLFALERWVCTLVVPVVLVLMLATLLGGHQLRYAETHRLSFLLAFGLIAADSVVNLITLRYFSALSAIGRIRESSYLQAATSLLTFLGGAVALALGGGIVAFFGTLVALALVSRPWVRWWFHRLVDCLPLKLGFSTAWRETRGLSGQLFREAAFLLLPMLAGRGMTIFLAGRFADGVLASIAISISVASLAVEFAGSFVMSQVPRFARLLQQGLTVELTREIRYRLLMVAAAGMAGMAFGGYVADWFLGLLGSQTRLLDWPLFGIVGSGLVLSRVCGFGVKIFHCTDRLSFLPTLAAANAISIGMFLAGGVTANLLLACLGIGWPLAVLINGRPVWALARHHAAPKPAI